jgi:hypothetical protein
VMEQDGDIVALVEVAAHPPSVTPQAAGNATRRDS